MKNFFLEILEGLYDQTGLKQFEYIKHDVDKVDGLIKALTTEANKFGHMPDEMKMRTIERNIMEDEEMKSITPKKVNRWLSKKWMDLPQAVKQKLMYGGEVEQHQPCEPEKAQEYINQWKKEFSKLDFSRLDPVPTSRRVFRDTVTEAVKIEQKVVECPGYGEKPCVGDECPM